MKVGLACFHSITSILFKVGDNRENCWESLGSINQASMLGISGVDGYCLKAGGFRQAEHKVHTLNSLACCPFN